VKEIAKPGVQATGAFQGHFDALLVVGDGDPGFSCADVAEGEHVELVGLDRVVRTDTRGALLDDW